MAWKIGTTERDTAISLVLGLALFTAVIAAFAAPNEIKTTGQSTLSESAPVKSAEQSTPVFPGRIVTRDDIGALFIRTNHAYGCSSRDDIIIMMANEIEDHSHEVAELKRSGQCRPLQSGTVLHGVSEPLGADCYQLDGAPLPCLWVRESDVARLTE